MSGVEMAKVIAIFLGVLVILLGLSRVPGVSKIPAESRRKALHIAAGLLAIALPSFFERAIPVIFLCGGVFVALVTLRLSAKCTYEVDRLSFGELCIPVAVAFLFASADGDPVGYYVPLMVFAFADSAAAIVGERWPGGRICVLTREKTVVGSVSFFLVALLVTIGGLVFFSVNISGKSLAIASIVAFDLTIVEALCQYGLDNVLVPVAGFLLLHDLSHASSLEFVVHLTIANVLALLLTLQVSLRPVLGRMGKRRAQ